MPNKLDALESEFFAHSKANGRTRLAISHKGRTYRSPAIEGGPKSRDMKDIVAFTKRQDEVDMSSTYGNDTVKVRTTVTFAGDTLAGFVKAGLSIFDDESAGALTDSPEVLTDATS